jgi:16S rRNA (guanine966-N2)-methyltransferase
MITTPRGMRIRPTRSLVRESLFNILGQRVVGARVIDLYAGAGTLGFEALSRGAAEVTFVDRDRDSLRAVAATAERFGCRDRCHLVHADAGAWVRRSEPIVSAASLCFLDAPYRDPDLERALAALADSPPELVVCEHHSQRRLPEHVGSLRLTREVRHGLTTLTFLQRIPIGEPTAAP